MLSKNVLTYFCLFAIILVGHYGERIVPGEVQVEENAEESQRTGERERVINDEKSKK